MAGKQSKDTIREGVCRITPSKRSDRRPSFVVRWIDETGDERQLTEPTIGDARDTAVKITSAMEPVGAKLQPTVLFRSLAADYLDEDNHQGRKGWNSPNTKAKYESLYLNHIKGYLGPRESGFITTKQFNEILKRMQEKGYADRTIKDVYDTMAAIVRHGQDKGVWDRWATPLKNVGVPTGVTVKDIFTLIDRASEVPTPNQVAELLTALGYMSECAALMAELAAESGLRWGEVVALRPCDIDLDRGRLAVVRQVLEVAGHLSITKPKHGKTRTANYSESVAERLEKWVAGIPDGGWRVGSQAPRSIRDEVAGLVFPSPRGSVFRRGSYGKSLFRPARAGCAYPDQLTFHSLRHFWVCKSINAGMRIETVSKLAGHHSVRFTKDRYWGTDDDYLDEAHRKSRNNPDPALYTPPPEPVVES